MTISKNDTREENDKIDLLFYLMGAKAEELMLQMPVKGKRLSEVLQHLDEYFKPKTNIVYTRYEFNNRIQQVGETIEEYIRALYVLAETCAFPASVKEEMIRDRLVVGVTSQRARERMLLNSKLTLEEAKTVAKEVEIYEKQGQFECNSTVERNRIERKGEKESQRSETMKNCWFCGRKMHLSRQMCPAVKLQCHNCRKTGHFARCCRRGRVNNVEEEMEVKYVNMAAFSTKYNIDVEVFHNDHYKCNLKFLIDTGADIVAVPEESVSRSTLMKMEPCKVSIKGPDEGKLIVLGTLQAKLVYNGRIYKGIVYVIRNLKNPILGVPAIESMKILKICSIVNKNAVSKVNVDKEFPSIFDSLGVFKEPFEIKVIDKNKSYIQCSPRVVPIPLLDKLKAELERLCSLGVITPVEEPTQYVSPIVVVPKDDTVRVCGDYTELNKNILRPVFPILKVEVILARLKGSKFYSKIDATSGFHQIPLINCAHLTTVITPFGRYMYNRLPFGVNCAPEYFSMKFSQLFHDLDVF